MDKRLFLFLIGLLVLCTQIHAEYVTIGSGTTTSYSMGYCNFYRYSTTQNIYTASEIGGACTINAIAFNVATKYGLATTSLKIYMGHKSSLFSSSSDYMTSSNLTLVYSGTPTLGSSTGWENLTLSTPFNYNGTDNLVVVICRQSSNYTSTLTYYYTSMPSSYYVMNRWSDDTSSYGVITGTYSYSLASERPNIRLTVDRTINDDKTATIGTGTSSTYSYPYRSNSYYSTVQTVYTAREIGSAGIIKNIAYNVASAYSQKMTSLKIYMGHKKSTFLSASDYMTSDDLTLVYDGSPTLGSKTGWEQINLDHDFLYNGKDNLVIVVSKSAATTNSSLSYYYTSSTPATGYNTLARSGSYQDYSDVASSFYGYSTSTYRPNVKIGIDKVKTKELTIGTGTASYTYPFNVGNYYSTVENLYSSSEVGGACTIENISYRVYSSGTDYLSSVKIYMGHRSSTFSASTTPLSPSDLTLVYDGPLTIGQSTGWQKIILDTPFKYNGTGYLAVVVCKQAATTYSYPTFYCTSMSGYNLYRSGSTTDYSDITNTATSFYSANYRPNIIIGKNNIAYSEVTTNSVNMVELPSTGKFTSLTIDDSNYKSFDVVNQFTVGTLNYERTFNNVNWQSLYLPFSMSYSNWSADFDVAKINNVHMYDRDNDGVVDDIEVEIKRVTSGSLQPNRPYLIKAKSTGKKTITVSNAIVYETQKDSIDCSSVDTKFVFAGIYSMMPQSKLNSANARFMSNGELVYAASSLSPFRWYMVTENRNASGGAAYSKANIRIVDEFVTESMTVEDTDEEASRVAVYGENGMEYNAMKQGLNIIKYSNGIVKRIFVK